MAAVALVGFVPSVADVVATVLAKEGHDVVRQPLNADAVREIVRRPPDAVVFDGHAYANAKAFLTDLRAQSETSRVPVVMLGPERPAEVPQFEVVHRVGRALDLEALLDAIHRVLGQLGD